MPIQKREMREIKKLLEAELARETIKPDRKLAIEQELQSLSIGLKEE